MSACGGCNQCGNPCERNYCTASCLHWGFDGCFLRGRCPDGTELEPLDLCKWLKTHETCTELKLVPQTTDDEGNAGYMSFINECGDESKFWVCDFLGLGNLECLNNVYDREQAKACDMLVFNPHCAEDESDPTYNKWTPYHIPDADDCVMEPDERGYFKVLKKNECGCIEECNLFAQSTTWEYALRDSWPDDPDWPFTFGSLMGENTEIIDLELDTKIPMFGKSDLEVTVQYAYGIQNHIFGENRNFKSVVTPSNVAVHTPALADTYSKAIVIQASNLDPWGSWEGQASRTFIVPKGEKLFLIHSIEVRDKSGNIMTDADRSGSSRLHALHVFVRATRGEQL